MNERQSISIFLNNVKRASNLKKYGSLQYVSKSLKYAVLYTDRVNALPTVKQIKKLPFVKTAYLSPRVDLKVNYRESDSTETVED
ncbi:YlbG family protein [Pediococcus argentinicus]|uniref:YlbG family protein n=1 Tax=Pediococcus argentinicus TaxID=480391 RepID=UPI00070DC91D|nr:YlbG family protein [Pediococcus argentinicus]NKZ22122.1 YlbG family protein [Pediococcus argentinicus]GEP19584.1 UPF0298 protein [Pediococcus argentinicus]